MTWCRIVVIFAIACARLHAGDAVATTGGSIQYSDGQIVSGEVTLAQALEVHDGTTVRAVPIAQVREIRLLPESEELVRAWRFVEPGQPKKEYYGEAYPVRHLTSAVVLMDGQTLHGHLSTTVAYVAAADKPDDRQRVMLPSKQQGKPGEALAAVIYPVRIVPTPAAGAAIAGSLLRIHGIEAGSEVVAIARDSLARIESAPGSVAGEYRLPAVIEPPAFIAARVPQGIVVAWPGSDDAAVATLVAGAVAEAKDFLDGRQILAVFGDGPEQVYALLMLRRVAPTTLEGPQQPWRLEVWRWKRDPADDRLMWAGRSYFFRGMATGDQTPTSIRIDTAWWSQTIHDDACEVGHER